jgi:HPr kinase/phosphorylase
MTSSAAWQALHASCVVVGEAGILLRGPSGSGKSTLARRIVEEARQRGHFARLVGDDRILLSVRAGRVLVRPHPALEGALEVRGIGIVEDEYADAAVVRLVVDCGTAPARFPDLQQRFTELFGVRIPLLAAGLAQADAVLLRLAAKSSPLETEPPST